MSEKWKNERGPLFKVVWPEVLEGIESDPTLQVFLDYASHVNEKGIAYLGNKGIRGRTGLWIVTIQKEVRTLEELKKMKKQGIHESEAGFKFDKYAIEHVQLWDPQNDPGDGMILPLANMRAQGFLKKPVSHWYKTSRKKREARYAKRQALVALCWLLACADVSDIPYDIVPLKVSDYYSVHKLLEKKLGISQRQVRRYMALFLDSKLIKEVKKPMMFDERGYRIRRYQFSKDFCYSWLRLPEKDEEGQNILAAQELDNRTDAGPYRTDTGQAQDNHR